MMPVENYKRLKKALFRLASEVLDYEFKSRIEAAPFDIFDHVVTADVNDFLMQLEEYKKEKLNHG